MIALRDNPASRLVAALAGAAVWLQLVLASWGVLVIASAAAANPFGPHALCLAASGSQPAQPARKAPQAPAAGHCACCCQSHALPALEPPTATAAPRLPPYAGFAPAGSGPAAFVAVRCSAPVNARAPPALA